MTICNLTGTYTYDRNVQVLWLASVVDVQAPTSTEVAAGIDLQPPYNLTDIIGWEIETDVIRDGIWGPFQEQRMGEQSISDSRLMFASARDGNDIRTLWDRGDAGYIMILPSGPYLAHLTAPVNCYPVRVAQLTQQQQLRTGGGSLILVSFVIRARAGENVLIVGP